MPDLNAEIVASSDDNQKAHPDAVEKTPSKTLSDGTLIDVDVQALDDINEVEVDDVSQEKRISTTPSKDPNLENAATEDLPQPPDEEAKSRSQETLMSKLSRGLSSESTAADNVSHVVSADKISRDHADEASEKTYVEGEIISFTESYAELLGDGILDNESADLKIEDMFPEDTESKQSEGGPIMLSVNPDFFVHARYVEDTVDRDAFLKGLIPTPSIKSRKSATMGTSSSSSSSSDPTYPIEEDDVQIDRKMYIQLHAMYTDKCRTERRKNNFYQTKMADYYMRRRMFHVLYADPKIAEDQQKGYGKLLEELESVHDNFIREQGDGELNVLNLQNKRRFRSGELDLLFQKFQKQEYEVAKENVASKDDAAKAIATKFIDRYMKRQAHELAFLSKIRLTYIKLHNKAHETQELLDSLDNLGPDLSVMNYQQSKNDNRTLKDKLEEKMMGLGRLREKCQNNTQILAHTREKVFALNKDIENLNEHLEEVTNDGMDIREQIAQLKADRDEMRCEIAKFKDQIGLLGKPKLLRHMQKSMEEVEEKKKRLEAYMDGVKNVTSEIRLLKRKSSTMLVNPKSQESFNV